MDTDIRRAIRGKRLIGFHYHGFERTCEPHVYGSKDGRAGLLCYQIGGGSSSGGIPEWRRFKVDEMTNLSVLEDTFPGRRPFPSGKHSAFDDTWEIVNP